jgi:hypothetical protein
MYARECRENRRTERCSVWIEGTCFLNRCAHSIIVHWLEIMVPGLHERVKSERKWLQGSKSRRRV